MLSPLFGLFKHRYLRTNITDDLDWVHTRSSSAVNIYWKINGHKHAITLILLFLCNQGVSCILCGLQSNVIH